MDYEKEFNEMQERFTGFEGKMNGMDNKLTKLCDSMMGNEFTQGRGWIHRFNEMEKEIADLRDFKKRLLWTSAIIMSISTSITAIILIALRYIVK